LYAPSHDNDPILPDSLVAASDGLPKKMIHLVNLMLQKHVEHDTPEGYLTRQDLAEAIQYID
jgi:hypothetical protein